MWFLQGPGDCGREVLELYRKRSGNPEPHLPSGLICRSVSDTALRLAGKCPRWRRRYRVVAALIDASGAQFKCSGWHLEVRWAVSEARRRPRPRRSNRSRPRVWAVSFLGAGHDRVMTSAIRGGVSQHPEIPTVLKTQLLRLD